MPAVLSPDLRIGNSDLVICSYQVQTFSLIFVCSDLNRFTTSRSQNGKAISKYLIQKRHRENRTSWLTGTWALSSFSVPSSSQPEPTWFNFKYNQCCHIFYFQAYRYALWYFLEYFFPVTEMICRYTNFKSNCYAPMLYKYNHFF